MYIIQCHLLIRNIERQPPAGVSIGLDIDRGWVDTLVDEWPQKLRTQYAKTA